MTPGPVIGIETEYGVLGAIRNPVQLSSLVVAAYKATQQGMVAPWDYGSEDPLNDARGFRLDRAAAHPSQLTDSPKAGSAAGASKARPNAARERTGPGAAMLANGARLYVDHAHPEYATPEVASARQAALWDKAGERVMLAAARALARDGVPAALYKNNTDGQGASYGTHENYLVPRALDWDRLVAGITPFLVTRQIYTGSGRVGLGQRSQEAGFQLSQRADFVEAEVGLETTLNRPIVNTRDEPHADPARWRRLHVIVGDATMMEVATYLRLGVTALVLRALAQASAHDADRLIECTALASPVAAFGQVSRDLSVGARLELKTRGAATALAIQRRYLEFAARALGETDLGSQGLGGTVLGAAGAAGLDLGNAGPGRLGWGGVGLGGMDWGGSGPGAADANSAGASAAAAGDGEAADLLARWTAILDGLETDPASLSGQLEWLAKLQVLEAMRARDGLGWDAPKLRAADLRWTDVDPATSLFAKLEAAGGVERLFTEDQIQWAVSNPPRSTRAYLKGETLRRFPDGVAAAGWDRLTLAWADGSASYWLADPLAGAQAQVGQALAAADSPRDLAARLAAQL